jgi:LPS sulfotransferase NodH
MTRKHAIDNSPIPIVILLGAARSGTTLLAEHLLADHPDIAYWGEPNHIWRLGTLYRKTDVRSGADATPERIDKIRRHFREYLDQSDGEILLEKSPANCLRIPFIRRIFPEAVFIHLIRDGRDVAISAQKEWRGGKKVVDTNDLNSFERIANWGSTLIHEIRGRRMLSTLHPTQIPHYIHRAYRLLTMRMTGRPAIWGPRIPNLDRIYRSHTLLETCAIQWRECVLAVMDQWREIPPLSRRAVRYEELLAHPEREVVRLLDFMQLEEDSRVLDNLEVISKNNRRKWESALTSSDLARLDVVIGTTLERLGYPRSSSEAPNRANT